MKLVSYSISTLYGEFVRIGALIEKRIVDLNWTYAKYLSDTGTTGNPYEIANAIVPPDMIEFLRAGQIANEAARTVIDVVLDNFQNEPMFGPKGEKTVYTLEEVKLLAPVPRPNSIRDTLSFEGHMKDLENKINKPMPELWYQMPTYYKGNPCTVIGPEEPIRWPGYTEKLDYELEYGIYIGKEGKNIPAGEAKEYIAGYTIYNDVSARDIQLKEKSLTLGPTKGKDFDTGNIMGPCLVTPDELDAGNLKMTARINGEVWSAGNTGDMYWSWEKIIEYISVSETLYPGDFIGSGTVPDGCGAELDRWLKPGDVIELEADGIGILRNQVVKEEE
jgi:2-keto-4-pentenoate hydratase/2-oxohepta-3-ene-1,7-dioic acid hydratase in catechol pathway